jgi:hypothetical protein
MGPLEDHAMLRQTIARVLPPLGFALALLSTPHCTMEKPASEDPANAPEQAESGVVLSAATWTLGWNTDGVEFDANGGFSVTTNLGYRVHIDTGHLVLHRVALVPCPVEPAETTSFFGLSIASVFAHEEDADPSSMETLAVSDMVHPKVDEVGANAFVPARYCQVYWLVARGMEGAVASDGIDMSNRSIFFEGTWERGSESGPLVVDTWWPAGIMTDMHTIIEPDLFKAASAESSVHFTWIGIDVALGKMFDDIEFEADSDAIIADTILDSMILDAQLTIDLQSP